MPANKSVIMFNNLVFPGALQKSTKKLICEFCYPESRDFFMSTNDYVALRLLN